MKNGALFSVPEYRVMRLCKTVPIYLIAVEPSGFLALFFKMPENKKSAQRLKDASGHCVTQNTLIALCKSLILDMLIIS
jgi:hypothetical protein